jgi:hypothetical protein
MPSLRQRQINEVLDYHQNMNHIVFNRSARHVAVSEQPSGQVDPSQTDIIIEGTIRDRISTILTSIQKLNQTIAYSTDVRAEAPVLSGSGPGKKHETDKQKKYRLAKEKEAKSVVSSADSKGTSSSSATPVDRSGFTVRGSPDVVLSSEAISKLMKDADKAQVKPTRSEGLPSRSSQSDSDTSSYQSSSSGKTSSQGTVPSLIVPGSKGSTVSIPMKGSVPAPAPIRTPVQVEEVVAPHPGIRIKSGNDSDGDDFSDAPGKPAPGIYQPGYQRRGQPVPAPVVPRQYPPLPPSPMVNRISELQSGTDKYSVKVDAKVKSLIDNALAGILSGYNSLVDYVKLQQQQQRFSNRDTQTVSGLLQTLVDPLKEVIVSALSLRLNPEGTGEIIKGQIEYTRIYNVLKDMINKIQDSSKGGPLIKVDPLLLNDNIPLRDDRMLSKDYDIYKDSTYDYLDELNDRLLRELSNIEYHEQHVHSDLERAGIAKKKTDLNTIQRKIASTGFPTDIKAYVEKINNEIDDVTQRHREISDEATMTDYEYRSRLREIQSFLDVMDSHVDDLKRQDPTSADALSIEAKINKLELRLKTLLRTHVDTEDMLKLWEDVEDLDEHIFELKKQRDFVSKKVIEKEARVSKAKSSKEAKLKAKLKKLEQETDDLEGNGKNDFGDDAELAPYLTKHLKPMMKTSLPAQSKAQAKGQSPKTGTGRTKKPKAQEPPFQMRKEQDLWFM